MVGKDGGELMRRGYKYKKKPANRAGRACITLIVFAMVGIMSVQIVKLYRKDVQYAAQEKQLEKQLAEEEERSRQAEEYEAYTKTQEYVEDVAKSKLGLVYKGEIVFKEE